jgi:hypothetical protein
MNKIYIGTSAKYKHTCQYLTKEQVENEMDFCDDLVIEETTESELLLKSIPEEFVSVLSYMAYERGHSAGESEVALYLRDLIYDLKPAIDKYTARLLKN